MTERSQPVVPTSEKRHEATTNIGGLKVSIERQRLVIQDQAGHHYLVFEPKEAEELRQWLAEVL